MRNAQTADGRSQQPPAIAVRSLLKDYRGLRPLRLASLDVEAGEVVTLDGLDQPAAAVLTDLLTGTALPDQGEVALHGQMTRDITSQEGWLRFLEGFGIVNERVVLLGALTVAQNLAVPLTLDFDPMPPVIRDRVEALADLVGLDRASLDAPLSIASPFTTVRVRLGRALAHDPRILLVEHPTIGLTEPEMHEVANVLRRVAIERRLAVLVVSSDHHFSDRLAARALAVRAATGAVSPVGRWRLWR